MQTSPHDVLFRWAFFEPERVAALLHAVLPAELVALIQWEGIRKVPVELLDKDLSEKRTDLVWRFPLLGRRGWLYVIVEHQSKTLRWMPLRIVDYERCVWVWWTDRYPRSKHLPPIVAVVVCNDPAGWRAPTQLWDLRQTDPELEAALGAKQPDVDFFLEDLHLRTDHDIIGSKLDAVGKLALLLLKHGTTAGDLLVLIGAWRGLFETCEDVWDTALSRFVWYILSVREDLKADEVSQRFTQVLGKRAGELVMTEAERLIALGEKRGERRGEKRGERRGEKRGKELGLAEGLAPLVRQIEQRIGRGLAESERTAVRERLGTLGPDRLAEVVLNLSSQDLQKWLSDPEAT